MRPSQSRLGMCVGYLRVSNPKVDLGSEFRDPDGGSPILSSAAPGRLHSASSVTSNNVGVVARRCVMVLNPRHQQAFT